MVQLSRYRGIAVVVGSLLVVWAIIDLTLTGLVGFTGCWLPNGEAPTDSQVYRVTGARISSMLLHPEPVGVGTSSPLGVLFGQSSLGSSVDTKVLEEHDALPMRWLNLHGWGTSINLMSDITELLFLSRLKPNVVVIAINPFMLIGIDFPTQHALLAKQEGKRLKAWIWLYNNRFVLNHGSRLLTHRIKLGLCRMFGFSFRSVFPALPEHVVPGPRKRLPAESPAAQAERLAWYQKFGWYDPGRYSPDSSNARSLVEVVRMSREMGAAVCIVLMPEHSAHRKKIPGEAIRCFAEINRINFPDHPVPVYDLRDTVPDDLFLDVVHPGIDAMTPVSILVGRCAKDLVSGRPAPERLQTGLDHTQEKDR
jgi:hypothetical protein